MKYYYAEACQNTFLLFDCLEERINDSLLAKAHALLKQSGRDDALLLTQKREEAHTLYIEMIVLGLDGQLGEFCGNGARASAAFLFAHYPHYQRLFLTSKKGSLLLRQSKEGNYSISLPLPSFHSNPSFIHSPFWKEGLPDIYAGAAYVEALEPHLVIPHKITEAQLLQIGRELNQRKDVFPQGINVNSYYLVEDSLFVSTYERGVQRLTLSCGTGSVACAAFYTHNQPGKVHITNKGGLLEVDFEEESVLLTGPASFMQEALYA